MKSLPSHSRALIAHSRHIYICFFTHSPSALACSHDLHMRLMRPFAIRFYHRATSILLQIPGCPSVIILFPPLLYPMRLRRLMISLFLYCLSTAREREKDEGHKTHIHHPSTGICAPNRRIRLPRSRLHAKRSARALWFKLEPSYWARSANKHVDIAEDEKAQRTDGRSLDNKLLR